MQMAGGALGMPLQIAGAFMGADAAKKRKKELEKIAQTPGVDLGATYGDVTKAGMAGLPAANELSAGMNMGAMNSMTNVMGSAIPGWSGLQSTRAGAVGSMLRGEIPQDVSDQVFRRGASKSVAGGYGGSEAGRNLVSRDLGLTSLDILGRGMTGMESMVRSTPLPRLTQASDILNITGKDAMGLRSHERTEKLDMLLGATNAPGSQDVWAKTMTDMGSQMASQGGGGGGGGAGGAMGAMSILGMF